MEKFHPSTFNRFCCCRGDTIILALDSQSILRVDVGRCLRKKIYYRDMNSCETLTVSAKDICYSNVSQLDMICDTTVVIDTSIDGNSKNFYSNNILWMVRSIK